MKKLSKSFQYAFRGLKIVFKEEQNFRIQIYAAIIVFFLALFFRIAPWEAVSLALMTVIVLVLELLNSIFERLSDILKPRLNNYVRNIKDIMAAAVLIASLCAIVVGLAIFIPYIVS